MICQGDLYITRQLQDLNPGLLKPSVLPAYHTDSQRCVLAQQTSELNLKMGSELGFLGIGKLQAETHTH